VTALLRRVAPACFGVLLVGVACDKGTLPPAPATALQSHSGPMAVSPDGSLVYVVHPDTDSVSAVNPVLGSIVFETLLAPAAPSMAAVSKRYEPSVMPRALVLDPTGKTLYVTGERNGNLSTPTGLAGSLPGLVYALDATTGAVLTKSAPLCAEPAGILIDSAGANLYVACSNDDAVIDLRVSDLSVVTRAALPCSAALCPHKPWALAWGDGGTLLATHLLGPGVSAFTTSPLAYTATWTIRPVSAGSDPTEPNGEVRGIYDAVLRPGTSELWVLHALLSNTTQEPTLAFNTTAFPAISILAPDGSRTTMLTVSTNPQDGGAFGDIVSGPEAITFSPDGKYAFVVDTNSEDVLVIDANLRAEATLVRPLSGHMPQGIAWSPSGNVYVMQRNTEDLAILDVTEPVGDAVDADASVGAGLSVVLEGSPLRTVHQDPMPANYRLGQQLFNSANSDELPITQNHWMACATCHIESRTDAITWGFTVGPRDTPSNAGGTVGTGFLLHTADRRAVTDYWLTINEEQGGDFHANATQTPLLEAIQDFVNYAIPVPVPPTTDPSLVARGQAVFGQAHCATCHRGDFKTDSGCGNPTLDLAGPEVTSCTPGGVLVHDVGTCDKPSGDVARTTPPFNDVPHTDMNGDPRDPCAFDTPALRGLWDSAPYMHDGKAATLDQAVGIMLVPAHAAGGNTDLSPSDRQALVEYLKSL
jgi:DNA-binding beta-propeller fold protein YncE